MSSDHAVQLVLAKLTILCLSIEVQAHRWRGDCMHSVNYHIIMVAITHGLGSLDVYSKAFGHYDICWLTHLVSSVIPTFIRSCKRLEA